MSGRIAGVVALVGLVVSGCVATDGGSSSWAARLRPWQGPTGSDVVQFDVVLLERPLGDAFLNNELWQSADERVVGPERRAAMEASGFRAGLVDAPSPLVDLLAAAPLGSEPRRRQTRAGKAVPLSLGPTLPHLHLLADATDDEPTARPFFQADCSLIVVAAPTKDGRLTLRLTPRVVHGAAESAFRVSEDHAALMLVDKRPTEDFSGLEWEVTLAPNQYLIVGGRYDAPETLGHQCFVRPEEAKPVQRLLVVRAGAPPREVKVKAQPLPGTRDDDDRGATPPLARQASGAE